MVKLTYQNVLRNAVFKLTHQRVASSAGIGPVFAARSLFVSGELAVIGSTASPVQSSCEGAFSSRPASNRSVSYLNFARRDFAAYSAFITPNGSLQNSCLVDG